MNNDLISREALKKEVKNTVPYVEQERILDIIDNAPTIETDIEVVAKDAYEHGYTDGWKERFGEPDGRPQGEWVPVSERLPEKIGTYLVTLEYKEHGIGITTLWYHGKGIGWDLRVADEVIAWQPLPEPYKKGEQE
jgi:hypothetical protein